MAEHMVNQFGDKSLYIEQNKGTVYVGDYIADPNSAFADKSYELEAYEPFIKPPIMRREVDEILEWIDRNTPDGKPNRVALLYGGAGIGKSVVMHEVLLKARSNPDNLVLGLKSDQIEFVDTNDLSQQMHLAKPLVDVIREMVAKVRRVVVLIDQIDALSLSLSSNRTPLRSLLKLIGQLRYINGVRIVISCRPYDMEYDPDLDNLKVTNKWELRNISEDEVKTVLANYGRNDDVSNHLLAFLGNPLHLVLYLKVIEYVKLKTSITQDLLYSELWNVYIVNIKTDKIDRNNLLDLLDILVSTMYERQELSVHVRAYETKYNCELAYLLHHGLLIKTKNGQIQFFHQTMFDYVYARRFVEKGQDLLSELSKQHQGLFSRAAVKSILSFQRETDPKQYKKNVEHLLFAQDENGKNKYRFHLKSLALSNMTFFNMPKKEEIDLISQKIFSNEQYFGVILESVHTGEWFDAIWSVIDSKGGWPSLSTTVKEKAMTMCHRTIWSDADTVLDISNKILAYENTEDKIYIKNLLSYQDLDCTVEKLISLYEKLVQNRIPLEYTSLLKNIIKDNPDYVCIEIKKNVAEQLAVKERPTFKVVAFSHEEVDLFQALEKLHHDHAIKLYVELLGIIMEATKFEGLGTEIFNSFVFSHFQRTMGGHFVHDFTEDIANKLINYFLDHQDTEQVKKYLANFCRSNYEGFVFIALFVFTEHPEKYFNNIYDILTSRSILSNAPCWVEYQGLKALKESFCFMNDNQKQGIVQLAETITDLGEYTLYYKERASFRMENGIPLLDVDVHRGKVLHAIPIDVLKRISWSAYQERLRIERKYFHKDKDGNKMYPRLENKKPFSCSSMYGWTSLGHDKATKMNCATWYKSMTKYVINGHLDWARPSLTGQSQLFRTVVAENPNKFKSLIDTIADDNRISLVYVESGMRGLLDAGRVEDAERVFSQILVQIKDDVNSTCRGFDIFSFLNSIDDFLKVDKLPKTVFNFLCNVVVNAKEPAEDNKSNSERDIYNAGINQARGHAGYLLVQCYCFEEYKVQIFDTLENVATKSSAYTRSAILLNMALLNCLDKKRNIILFKKLMHDYDSRLMAMPVHNHNPLVYFINYAVDELMEFFRHAADTPSCYKQQIILLWLAWSHNNHHESAGVLLDKMCNESEEARIALLHFLCTLDNQMNADAEEYILHVMEPQYESAGMGAECDNIFLHIDEWEDDVQIKIAKAFVDSPMCKYADRGFLGFLAGYAISDPLNALVWLEAILNKKQPNDYNQWNQVTDVLIQSYNGIKSFDIDDYRDILEKAMDMMDQLMQNKDSKYLITNFINKLDNE